MGGGIGGGSSNAATTLLALNYLWQTNLSIDELAEIGLNSGLMCLSSFMAKPLLQKV